MGQMCMTDADARRDNFILPVILPSGKDILADYTFKIGIMYTNIDTCQIQSRFGSRVCLLLQKIMSLLAKSRDVPASYYVKPGDTKM